MRAPNKLNRNFRQHFEELVNELDTNPNIDLVELEFGEPASNEVLRQAQEALGVPIPWEIRSFHREMNGFKLRWVLRNAEELSEELEVEVPEDHSILILPLY
ncbi:MAG: SMI1/KNR4 family protein, partial [Deltaproteobacteria bacterium]|nr:SMI1/KNR4 family protein [Deltaproteobacteria bacterium]